MRVQTDKRTATYWRYNSLADSEGVGRMSGRCEQPVSVELQGAPDRVSVGLGADNHHRAFADIEVPCRKCGACLRARAGLWRRRATEETRGSVRTWFVTMTLSPDNHARVTAAVEAALLVGGSSIGQTPDDDVFRKRCEVIGPHITKYLKRMRKISGAALRYCLVAERHKSGLPHYHMLLHETDFDRPLRYRVIVDQWKLGFSSAKLADLGSAGYVAKYLSKASAARVRASVRYGQ